MKKKISIIASFKNEEKNIIEFINRIKNSFKKFRKIDYKLIFIDDCSDDNSNKLIKNAATKNKKIKLITLKKNYGHDPSVQTGFDFVGNNNYATIIDCDLQEDPELIAKNFNKIKNNETIHFVRKRREDPLFQRFYSRLAYLFLHFISGGKIIMNTNHFKLIPPNVVKKVKKVNESHPYWNYLLTKFSSKNKIILYVKKKRTYGLSKFNIFTLNPWLAFFSGVHYFNDKFVKLISSLLLINICLFIIVYSLYFNILILVILILLICFLVLNLFISAYMTHYKKINKRIRCKYK